MTETSSEQPTDMEQELGANETGRPTSALSEGV
jgi:hypothetical protein